MFGMISFFYYRPQICEGYVFTRVCHSVHRGGVRGCSGGACVVAPGGRGHAWLLGGVCVVAPGGCMVAPGGHVWLLWGGGACVVAPGGHAWFFLGRVCGFFWVVCVVFPEGACMVFSEGGHACFFGGHA